MASDQPSALEAKLSIVIPSKDNPAYLSNCVASIARSASADRCEIVIVDSGSRSVEALQANEVLKRRFGANLIVRDQKGQFNFPELVNAGAAVASGEWLVLLNDDTELLDGPWLTELLETGRSGEAVVGALLCYSDLTVQHGGIAPDPEHLTTHIGRGDPVREWMTTTPRSVWATTGAAMLIPRRLYERLGGFDEAFAVSYNDIDFCRRAAHAGAEIVVESRSFAFHFESKSRGLDAQDPVKAARHLAESERFVGRWGAELLELGVDGAAVIARMRQQTEPHEVALHHQ
jgi:GT2 family glycosyltransferase